LPNTPAPQLHLPAPQRGGSSGGTGMVVVQAVLSLVIAIGVVYFMAPTQTGIDAAKASSDAALATVNALNARVPADMLTQLSTTKATAEEAKKVAEAAKAATTQDISGFLTQAQVDARAAVIIQQWIDDKKLAEPGTTTTTTTGGTTTTTGDYGTLIDSDRDLELWLARTNPGSDPMRINDGGDDAEFEIWVVNTEDTYHDFRLYLRMTPEDDVACTQATTNLSSYPDTGVWTVTRNTWGSSEDAIYFSMDADDTIGKLKAEDYLLVATIDATTDEFWNYRLTIEQMD